VPAAFLGGRDLDGDFLVYATNAGRIEASRPVEFLSNVLAYD
jgi:hypothetical protein